MQTFPLDLHDDAGSALMENHLHRDNVFLVCYVLEKTMTTFMIIESFEDTSFTVLS